MSSTSHGGTPYYFVPEPSRHPASAAFGLFFVILGASQWVNDASWGKYSLFFGLAVWLFVLYQWFGQAISESQSGQYGRKIDLSFRWSMSWFIFSEVMFFGAFFSALWWKLKQRGAVARIQVSLANRCCWGHRIPCKYYRALSDDDTVLVANNQYCIAPELWYHHYDCT